MRIDLSRRHTTIEGPISHPSFGHSARENPEWSCPRPSSASTIDIPKPQIRDLRAQPSITSRFGPPMHPAWLRCSKLKYLDILHFSRLASRAPRLEDSFGTTRTRIAGVASSSEKGNLFFGCTLRLSFYIFVPGTFLRLLFYSPTLVADPEAKTDDAWRQDALRRTPTRTDALLL